MPFTQVLLRRISLASVCVVLSLSLHSQASTCPYPVLLMHGWTGDNTSWESFYSSSDVTDIFGTFDTNDHVFWAMPNAEDTHVYYEDCCTFLCLFQCTYLDEDFLNDDINGADDVWSDNGTDDDVQWVFDNEDNVLAPGCVYAYSFNVGKNADGTIFKNPSITSTAPCDDCSDNNESAVYKQGYAVRRAIEAVLDANPDKDKVILVGHSMGGMAGREYLQRQDSDGTPTWWVDPDADDGHKVAKFATLGSPLRGSNFFSAITVQDESDEAARINNIQDLDSEAIRDIRYNYSDGLFDNIPSPYLFGGLESDIANTYWSYDVNCDGDDDDVITGVNISGIDQGYDDEWDGTTYNPDMPLPTNLKYTYYVSDGDGIVDEPRQWLYLGGDGGFGDYADNTSIPEPTDGTDHRLSDRVNSGIFHTSQNDDVNGIARLLDEGDYPYFAFEVDTTQLYFGLVQKRAEIVPTDSDYTLSGNNLIDGDWYKFSLEETAYAISVDLTTHNLLSGRVDLYRTMPTAYDNTNSPDFSTWTTNNSQIVTLELNVGQYQPGTYYLRITHDLSSASGDEEEFWKTPYTFQISTINRCEDTLHLTGTNHNGTYEATSLITSDATLTNGTPTQYFAGDTICLTAGFEIPIDGLFEADIEDCVIGSGSQ